MQKEVCGFFNCLQNFLFCFQLYFNFYRRQFAHLRADFLAAKRRIAVHWVQK